MEELSLEQIIKQYPDEWVLVGNPRMKSGNFVGPIIQHLIAGTVLYHSKDKREIGYKAVDLARKANETACIYTGEIPKNRKFWL